MARYELRPIGVWDNVLGRRITRSDGMEWGDYRQWLRSGNVPDPQPVVPPPTPTQAELDAAAELEAREAAKTTLRADATITYLRTHTPAEVAAYVQTNVTDLASAKAVLVKLAMLAAYNARERLNQ